jgi:hypothetical protein
MPGNLKGAELDDFIRNATKFLARALYAKMARVHIRRSADGTPEAKRTMKFRGVELYDPGICGYSRLATTAAAVSKQSAAEPELTKEYTK